jgi:hypothetical protein
MPCCTSDWCATRRHVHVLDEEGRTVEVRAVRPEASALRTLASHIQRHGQEVSTVIESMTGSRFLHDALERSGWEVAIADPLKARGPFQLARATPGTWATSEAWPGRPTGDHARFNGA